MPVYVWTEMLLILDCVAFAQNVSTKNVQILLGPTDQKMCAGLWQRRCSRSWMWLQLGSGNKREEKNDLDSDEFIRLPGDGSKRILAPTFAVFLAIYDAVSVTFGALHVRDQR